MKGVTSTRSLHRFTVSGFAIIIVLALTEPSPAQTRYKDIVFPSAAATESIQYGSNLKTDGSTDTLLMDLSQPTGDNVTSR